MLKLFQVSGLTRPARLRVRSQLVTGPCPHDPLGRQRKYASAATAAREVEEDEEESGALRRRPTSGIARIQELDYLQAKEQMAKSDNLPRLLKRDRDKSKSTLPSIFDLAQQQKEKSSLSEAGPSSISTSPVAVRSRASRKGKERASDLHQDQVDLAAAEFDHAIDPSTSTSTKLRKNAVGVQLLSQSLHDQLFPGPPLPKPPESLLDISLSHLRDHGLSPDGAASLPEVSFNMPPLLGNNIRDHFRQVGENTAEPYLSMAKQFANSTLPSMPDKWQDAIAGWTKYNSDGSMESVPDLGDEKIVSFDVETLYKLSPYPVMATAATPHGWYSWLSPTIFENPPSFLEGPSHPTPPWETSTATHHPRDLIPLFQHDSTPRIVIGHNVGYDRARVFEEYSLNRTSTRWIDTLSLHVATRGITSVQRPAWMKYKKNKVEKALRTAEALQALKEVAATEGDEEMVATLEDFSGTAADVEAMQKRWEDVTSMNSLAEVAFLHCGVPVDKSIRDRFGDEGITHASQLRPELQDLLTYCGGDVRITHQVYQKVLPLFFESCPHPASFAGVMAMGSSFLPVNESWKEYLKNAEETYRKMDLGVKKALRVLAEKVRKEGRQEGDPWSEQLDWTPKPARWEDEAAATATSEASDSSTQQTGTVETSEGLQRNDDVATPTPTSNEPSWLEQLRSSPSEIISTKSQRYLLPLLLRLSYKSHPVVFLPEHYWCFRVPHGQLHEYVEQHGSPIEDTKHEGLHSCLEDSAFFRISGPDQSRRTKLNGPSIRKMVQSGDLTSPYPAFLQQVIKGDLGGLEQELLQCATELNRAEPNDPWRMQLETDVTAKISSSVSTALDKEPKSKEGVKGRVAKSTWPKWYWDLTSPPSNSRVTHGELDLTIKKIAAPLLLRLQWHNKYPLIFSREHKWLYRVPVGPTLAGTTEGEDEELPESLGRPIAPAQFTKAGDETLKHDTLHRYYRLPHKDGEGNNVGNPLSKSFVKAIESGDLSSAAALDGDDAAAKAASDATNMNVLCSYWMSSRERIMDQMVVYPSSSSPGAGMILPQVITMGTVTRRAVEATWLTASNAKKNRVGSELKAMVQAPPGYAIVGADVDSEELWISSVMGDSQFGMHGATAIGWMTLEGTKSAGTDLHSKTAKILGITRDAAKVFNYSRIYGAGQKHAVQLLLQGDSTLTKQKAFRLAINLYKATKGDRAFRNKTERPAPVPSIWHGGSESYLFNTLEAIALSDRPTTPALGCGVTRALRKSYLEQSSSYLPSRINWVVQSSGVDYLHLLIVSMEYLLKKYDIKARYLISVHDEVRYLAEEKDQYRTALALQIANAWTRALFCYNLGIDDLPQGITFFSAVDVDRVLRKEVFMTCETPSHPIAIPPGESLDIQAVLDKTNGGDLGPVAIPDHPLNENGVDLVAPVKLFSDIQSSDHHQFLAAQAESANVFAKRWLDNQEPIPGSELPPPPPPPRTRSRSKTGAGGQRSGVKRNKSGGKSKMEQVWDEEIPSIYPEGLEDDINAVLAESRGTGLGQGDRAGLQAAKERIRSAIPKRRPNSEQTPGL